MSAAKPADLVLWVPGDEAAKMTSPSSAKRVLGWESDEKPAFQTMNYLQNNWGKWAQYVNTMPYHHIYSAATKDLGFGYGAFDSATVNAGSSSIAIGYYAGDSVNAAFNIYIGEYAGQSVIGSGSVYIGHWAGKNAAGANQIFIGRETGESNKKNNTIGIGYYAARAATHGNDSIFIGTAVGAGAALGTDSVVWIGNSSSATPLIQGNFTTGLLIINGDLTSTGTIKGANYQSGDGTAGLTQTTAAIDTFDIVIKDGLITSLTKNS